MHRYGELYRVASRVPIHWYLPHVVILMTGTLSTSPARGQTMNSELHGRHQLICGSTNSPSTEQLELALTVKPAPCSAVIYHFPRIDTQQKKIDEAIRRIIDFGESLA